MLSRGNTIDQSVQAATGKPVRPLFYTLCLNGGMMKIGKVYCVCVHISDTVASSLYVSSKCIVTEIMASGTQGEFKI